MLILTLIRQGCWLTVCYLATCQAQGFCLGANASGSGEAATEPHTICTTCHWVGAVFLQRLQVFALQCSVNMYADSSVASCEQDIVQSCLILVVEQQELGQLLQRCTNIKTARRWNCSLSTAARAPSFAVLQFHTWLLTVGRQILDCVEWALA